MLTRREWLSLTALNGLGLLQPAATERETRVARIARIVADYERQGFHRTGTAVDNASGVWLSDEVRRAGLAPVREPFVIDRVDPITATLSASGRRIAGLPQFDAAFTDAAGVRGHLSALDGNGEIGLAEAVPNTAAAGAVGAARRSGRFNAIVLITRGQRPGLCPNNADFFLEPFGPPVLQVGSEEAPWLTECARDRVEVHLVAHVKRTRVEAFNVTTRMAGTNVSLQPLVVMTPRSGWYACASERGGGIACWLELMRAARAAKPARDIIFVASSGHELGHLGINAFVDRRPGIVRHSAAWMHFGANIGAASDPRNTVQASDDELEQVLADALLANALSVDTRVPRGTVPGGEAEVVHRGGGHYLSSIGRNALFHNPADRGADAVAPRAIAAFIDAFAAVAKRLAA